jgi:ribosomal protein L37AE/L43A
VTCCVGAWRFDFQLNPIWTTMIFDAVKVTRKCPHCGKKATYPRKASGHFYTCKRCGHRFKEKSR